jgi:Pentapeptide repeats (8 copies)
MASTWKKSPRGFVSKSLWETLANLPAFFEDGRSLCKRSSLWLLSGFVQSHVVRLKESRSFLSFFQEYIFVLLAWWTVPFTLLLFWVNYLPRHDLLGTLVHVLLLVVSIWAAYMLYDLAITMLQGEQQKPPPWRNALKGSRNYLLAAVVVILALLSLLPLLSSLGTLCGAPSNLYTNAKPDHIQPSGTFSTPCGGPSDLCTSADLDRLQPQTAAIDRSTVQPCIPRALAFIGYSPFANLEEEEVSTKPPNWVVHMDTAEETGKAIEAVQGARLAKSNLQFANLLRAFLAKANLHEANLRGADLFMAQLQGADLSEAQLQRANLSRFNFWPLAVALELRWPVHSHTRPLTRAAET